MSVTTEDVQEWVKLQWTGNATLAPVQLINGFTPEAETNPQYAEFKVQDGPVKINASTVYVQEFTVELRTYDQAGAQDLGTYKQAIETAFMVLQRTSTALPSGRTLQLLSSIKAPGNIDEDPATQQGEAVMVSLDRYNLLCQG